MVDWDIALVLGFPFIVAICGIGYAAFRRYLKHKERMAMIERGLVPPEFEIDEEARVYRSYQASPVAVTLIGVAITLGLLTLGIGPWLIGGLVPTAVGCAMLINQLRNEAAEKAENENAKRGDEDQ